MLAKLLMRGQFAKLATLVSPAFFDVMPAKQLWGKARELYAHARDREACAAAEAERAGELRARLPQVALVAQLPESRAHDAHEARDAERAALVMELYFHQLFSDRPTIIDLQSSVFAWHDGALHWRPGPGFVAWAPEFIAPLRQLYRGFYARDDAQFRAGLAALSLSHSEDLFRQQFGGNQARMEFRTREFVDIFHDVFVRCKRAQEPLHPDFLALGVCLATLYEHLERLGVAVDVAHAFARAT